MTVRSLSVAITEHLAKWREQNATAAAKCRAFCEAHSRRNGFPNRNRDSSNEPAEPQQPSVTKDTDRVAIQS